MTELQRFFSWLADTHPETYSNYNRNFQESPGDGVSVAVNNNYRITDEGYQKLLKSAQDWSLLKHS